MVQLNFSDFSTELGIDTVKVCDGVYCVMDTVIAELSGELDAGRLHYRSTKNAITVELSTDGILNQKGFQASYSMLATSFTPGLSCAVYMQKRLLFHCLWLIIDHGGW